MAAGQFLWLLLGPLVGLQAAKGQEHGSASGGCCRGKGLGGVCAGTYFISHLKVQPMFVHMAPGKRRDLGTGLAPCGFHYCLLAKMGCKAGPDSKEGATDASVLRELL